MRRLLLATVALAPLAALTASPARADAVPPYPWSDLGITWETGTYRSGGLGGDLWPVTAGADGRVYTAWGDGKAACPAYVSYGTAALAGGPSATLRRVGCEPLGW